MLHDFQSLGLQLPLVSPPAEVLRTAKFVQQALLGVESDQFFNLLDRTRFQVSNRFSDDPSLGG